MTRHAALRVRPVVVAALTPGLVWPLVAAAPWASAKTLRMPSGSGFRGSSSGAPSWSSERTP
jgi:hypothetical protein